ncbi:MAG: hypothetical protein AB7K24_23680 [Gemmataceae bacterium]
MSDKGKHDKNGAEVLSLVKAQKAKEIHADLNLSDEAKKLQADDQSPLAYLDALLDSGLHTDAVTFLAHAMPRREAIWWGCLSVRHAHAERLLPKDVEALHAALAWVLEPTDTRAKQAKQPASEAGMTAPGCMAVATTHTTKSAEPRAAALSVSAGIKLLVRDDKDDCLRHILVMGIGIASGQHSWAAPEKKKRP